jgi:Flp pilus assembly protein TadB
MIILLTTGNSFAAIVGTICAAIVVVTIQKINSLHASFDKNLRERKNKLYRQVSALFVKSMDNGEQDIPYILEKFKLALENEEDSYQSTMTYAIVWLIIGLFLATFIYMVINWLIIPTSIILIVIGIITYRKYQLIRILNKCLRSEASIVLGKGVKRQLSNAEEKVYFKADLYYRERRNWYKL